MAFDFLGTFTSQDLEGLNSYLLGEIIKTDALTNNTLLEVNKLQKTLEGLYTFANRTNVRTKWSGMTFDRRIYQQVDDTDSALLVQQTKEPYYPNLKEKEELEHRIKKIQDTIEQMQERVYNLRYAKNELTTNVEKVNSLFSASRPYLKRDQIADTTTVSDVGANYTVLTNKLVIAGSTVISIRVVDDDTGQALEGKTFTNDTAEANKYTNNLKKKYPSAKFTKD